MRTVWGPSQSWDYAGGRFQILGVEVYEHTVSVTWRASPRVDVDIAGAAELAAVREEARGLPTVQQEQLLDQARRRLDFSVYRVGLTDDVGTDYRGGGGGGGGGRDERRGHQGFWPAPPPEATRLILTWQDQLVEVPLS